MDVRWKVGTLPGHTPTTGEHNVGVRNGNVIKSRSLLRVVEPSRWDVEALERIAGVPGCLKFVDDDNPSPDDVEQVENPHDFAEEDVEPGARERRAKPPPVPKPDEPERPKPSRARPPAPPGPAASGQICEARADHAKGLGQARCDHWVPQM